MKLPHSCRILTFLLLLLTIPGLVSADDPAPFLTVEESGGIVYWASTSPPLIKRYNLQTATWLGDLVLPEPPTAFTVDQQYLYISFGRRTSRFNLNGSGEAHLKNTPYDVTALFVLGNHLVMNAYDSFWSVDKLSGNEIDSESYFYSMEGIDVSPTLRKAFGRTTGVSPSDIVSLALNADGTFGEQQGSPYHGDYPDGSRTFVFPGEARVADDSGIVYNTSDLSYSNSLGGAFDDLAFYGDLPIVMREGEVVAYSNALLETGRHEPPHPPLRIFVRGEEVFSFYQGAGGLGVDRFSIDLLEPGQPGEPVNPNGLAYEPDSVFVGKDNVVYLLSRANLSIFRWSIHQQRYLETIPLLEAPSYMAYSAKTHRIYLTYPAGTIRQIRLDVSTGETPFANTPQTPCGLATAGEFVFVCDPSGAWGSHLTYTPDGALLSQVEWNYYSVEYTWSEANRKMYFFSDSFSPTDIHWESIGLDGRIVEAGESPYHGDIRTLPPIRVAPDGSIVLLGSGEIFDAQTLERTDSLSNDITDGGWILETLFTLRPLDGGTEIQKWGANYGITARRSLPGTPLRLFGRHRDFLVITSVSGIPQFSLWDTSLNPANDIVPTPLSLGNGRFSVLVTWQTHDGLAGAGQPVRLTQDTGYFWFFSPSNVEMILKVLDACSYNGRFWIFAGGLTNVQVEITVVDNQTGLARTYLNPQGSAFQPIQDTAGLRCTVGSTVESLSGLSDEPALDLVTEAGLALNNDRFEIEIDWQSGGQNGTGQAVELSSDTGYFWFFGESNVEVVAKVLDGCAANGKYWVFAGGLTNVHTVMRVTDTHTGQVRTYQNPQGQAFQPLQDTAAFDCP